MTSQKVYESFRTFVGISPPLELKGNGGPSGEAFHIQNNLFIASALFSNYLFVAT